MPVTRSGAVFNPAPFCVSGLGDFLQLYSLEDVNILVNLAGAMLGFVLLIPADLDGDDRMNREIGHQVCDVSEKPGDSFLCIRVP